MTNEALAISKLFYIQDKDGQRLPFVLNQAQRFLDKNDDPTSRRRIIISKPRQKGFSSVILAKFSIRCLGRDGTHAVVISHEGSATQRLFDRVDYYLKYMNGPKPKYGLNSRKELSFPIRDSTFYIGTAGARAFGRGDWITDLHLSEYAYWEHPETLTVGLFQAVPYNGRIYIESTGNGRNNDFYYIWTHADNMDFVRLFYPWYADREYSLPLEGKKWTPDLPRYNDYLLEMKEKFNISDEQMYWYELKLKEMREDLRMMQQEYPSTPEESFQATGGTLFPFMKPLPNLDWKLARWDGIPHYRLATHPKDGFHYVLGGDPSGGVGRDDAAIIGLCVETSEQVLELASNTVNPIQFGRLLCALGRYYNDAFIVCESNNHGAAVIPYLKENYPSDKIYKRKYATKSSPAVFGWNNSPTTKHELVGLMQETLDQIKWYGSITTGELNSFKETEDGKMVGRSDNTVIAAGLALLGWRHLDHYRREYNKPKPAPKERPSSYMYYTFEELIGSINARRDAERSQAGLGYPNN